MSDAADPKPENLPAAEPAPDVVPEATADAASEPAAAAPPAETQELAPEDRPDAAAVPATTSGARQVVYVHAPVPPKVAHNRLFGALIALLGTVAFALIYFGVAAAFLAITHYVNVTGQQFVNTPAYWVPILFYAVGSVVLAVAANRAPWWAHVAGSALVAIFVYWLSVSVLTLTGPVAIFAMTPEEASARFWGIASSPILFVAALAAREVSMWFGLAISNRGRKVRERNAVAKAAYDAEQAEKKAEYERAAATV